MINQYQKGFGIIELIVIFAVVTLISVLGWVIWDKIINSPIVDTDAEIARTERKKNATTLSPEDITNELRSVLGKKYKLLDIDKNNTPKEGELSVRVKKASPMYKADGYDFYISYGGGSTIDMMPYEPNDRAKLPTAAGISLRKEAVTLLTNFGLEKGVPQIENAEQEIYVGKSLICSVESLIATTSENTVSCGKADEYKTAAAAAKPLVSALPGITPTMTVGNVKITNSPVSGYQRAYLGTGDLSSASGMTALFYKKDNKWTYLSHTQNTPICMSFNSDDARAAFSGEPCLGSSGEQTKVQYEQKNALTRQQMIDAIQE